MDETDRMCDGLANPNHQQDIFDIDNDETPGHFHANRHENVPQTR